MTVGSLFAGIGGFDLGLERAGFEIKWQVEIDPFCRAVLEKHWPKVKRYEDVRTVGAELEYVDWICGGFPCQDLSSAGKRAGLFGARSSLYREFVRIVEARKPRGVLIENVHHAWRQWVPELRRALWCLGYASLPLRMRASDFGAEHERRRAFVVAHIDASVLRLESWRRGWPFWEVAPIFADAVEGGCGAPVANIREGQPDAQGRFAANAYGERQLQPEGFEPDERGWARHGYRWPPEPDVVRVVHGVPSRAYGRWLSQRVAALGNAVIPVQIEWIGRRILEAEGFHSSILAEGVRQ